MYIMYYIMLDFLFLYIVSRKTKRDIFKLVGTKIWSGKTREFQIALPIDTLINLKFDLQSECKSEFMIIYSALSVELSNLKIKKFNACVIEHIRKFW